MSSFPVISTDRPVSPSPSHSNHLWAVVSVLGVVVVGLMMAIAWVSLRNVGNGSTAKGGSGEQAGSLFAFAGVGEADYERAIRDYVAKNWEGEVLKFGQVESFTRQNPFTGTLIKYRMIRAAFTTPDTELEETGDKRNPYRSVRVGTLVMVGNFRLGDGESHVQLGRDDASQADKGWKPGPNWK